MPLVSPLRSLKINEETGEITIIDQILLPHTIEWLTISTIKEAYDAIKNMQIRGAPAIASLAALTFAANVERSKTRWESVNEAKSEAKQWLDELESSRPTAVNLSCATARLHEVSERVAASQSADVIAWADEMIKEARLVHSEDLSRNHEMSAHAAKFLVNHWKAKGHDGPLNVMTVCNTGSLATSGYGTALGVITKLFEDGNLDRAYYTQTTPYHQGSRLTSLELLTLDIPSTMLCDTMVGSLFQRGNIHAVVVGADRIAANGDTANKIGTYQAAVLAKRHDIPFLAIAPISTVDLKLPDGSGIPIEHRPPQEACIVRGVIQGRSTSSGTEVAQVKITPPKLDTDKGSKEVYNPAFDVTPNELITGVVTEKGVAFHAPEGSRIDVKSVC